MKATDMNPATRRPFTGGHMLTIMLVFFGVIISVNVTMATLANTSWTGFVVKNSYIASQEFNRKAEAGRRQQALGWTGKLEIADGWLRYAVSDAADRTVELSGGRASFRRPTSDREDAAYHLAANGGVLEAAVELGDGVWIVEILADAGLAASWRDARRLVAREGTAR